MIRQITTESPLTKQEMFKLNSRLDEIESIIDGPQVPDDVLINLIDELESIVSMLERANKISIFLEKGLRLIKS